MTALTPVQISDCREGDVVVHQHQEWRIGEISNGERILYGITRRKVTSLPAYMIVERKESN